MEINELAAVLTLPLMLNACSTAPKSILMGAVAGGSAGAGLGQSQSQNSGGTAIGTLVGAGLGSIIGYLAFNDKQKKEVANASAKKESPEELAPFLTRPKIRSYIVPDTIEGNKFIKSHRIFILENPGEWSKD
ncbi:MAG: glycine zipper domain-containing protein [Pseudobdellovibrionaceae bacterium]